MKEAYLMNGLTLAFIVVWYDNILVIAESVPLRDKLISRINANVRTIRAGGRRIRMGTHGHE
jgi:hypothetical protein